MLNFLISIVIIFMSIAFFTIMERKILGSIHIRLGPNKVGIMGLFQPFSDAIKLFSKSLNMISKAELIYWNISPILLFLMFMIMMLFFPIKMENNMFNFNLLYLTFILGLPNFLIFWSSFFSFNKFSIISSKRCISQLISYEMGLVFSLISIMLLMNSMNLEINMINFKNFYFSKFFLLSIVFILILSESSRIPFDFIEGESELVSGFNIEFSSCYFSLFFIYEYGMMLFFSILISMILLNFFFSFILIFLFILIRSCLVRIRYDQMMMFIWKLIYPIIIPMMIFLNYF